MRDLWGFPWRVLVLSALLHVLLLSLFSHRFVTEAAGVAPRAALHAELRAGMQPSVAQVAVSREPTLAAASRSRRSMPAASTAAPVFPTPISPAPVPAVAQAAEPGGVPQAGATSGPATVAIVPAETASGPDSAGLRQFRLALAGEARRFRIYPDAARRTGLSGTVEVRVAVMAGGAGRFTELAHSSGHALLDAAAVEMVSKAAPLAPLPDSLRGHDFAVLLPIVFEIEE